MLDPSPAIRSVFISYSRADLLQVRALAMALRRTGVKTWLDLDDLLPGQKWKEAIGGALAVSDAMVFCMSSLSLESAWTGVELRKAQALSLPIIPVAIEAVDLSALPEPLRDLHVHDMSLHAPRHAAALTARGIAAALGVGVAAGIVRANGKSVDSMGRERGQEPGHERRHEPSYEHGFAPADDPGESPNGRDAPTIGPVAEAITVVMDPAFRVEQQLLLEVGGPEGTIEVLDFSQPEFIRLSDLVDGAGRARRVVLIVGASADPALVGLVLGTLFIAFGSRRLTVLSRDEPTPQTVAAARLAGVRVERC